MEILSYNSANCSLVVRRNSSEQNPSLRKSKLFNGKRCGILLGRIDLGSGFLRYRAISQFGSNNFMGKRNYSALHVEKGSRKATFEVLSGSYDSYVIGEEDGKILAKDAESLSKVLIPGLPDEPNGDSGAPISSDFWEWKPKLNVHYEKAGMENVKSPAVLFLPGFGVGSFHYEKQLKDLGRDFRVWALDFLGQGRSLPNENPTPQIEAETDAVQKDSVWGFGEETEPWAHELVYSMDLWRDQVQYFVEEVYISFYQLSPSYYCS